MSNTLNALKLSSKLTNFTKVYNTLKLTIFLLIWPI